MLGISHFPHLKATISHFKWLFIHPVHISFMDTHHMHRGHTFSFWFQRTWLFSSSRCRVTAKNHIPVWEKKSSISLGLWNEQTMGHKFFKTLRNERPWPQSVKKHSLPSWTSNQVRPLTSSIWGGKICSDCVTLAMAILLSWPWISPLEALPSQANQHLTKVTAEQRVHCREKGAAPQANRAGSQAPRTAGLGTEENGRLQGPRSTSDPAFSKDKQALPVLCLSPSTEHFLN